MRTLSGLKSYLDYFIHFKPGLLVKNFIFILFSSLLEGVNLLLLVPLLALAGYGGDIALPEWLESINQLVERYQLELNISLILAVFVCLIIIQSYTNLYRDRLTQQLRLLFVDHLRSKLYRLLTYSRWSYFNERHSTDFSHVLTGDIQRVGQGTFFLLRFISLFIMIVVYLSVAFHLSVGMTFIALTCGSLLWLSLRSFNRHATESGAGLSRTNQHLFRQLHEHLSAMKTIKAHGEHKNSISTFNQHIADMRQELLSFNHAHTLLQMNYRIGSALCLGIFTYIALQSLEIPIAALLVLIAIIARLLPMVSQLQGGYQQLLHMLPAFYNWEKLVKECEKHQEKDIPGHSTRPLALRQYIKLEDISYRHPGASKTLRYPQLYIPANKTTLVQGGSGSGKTTLVDLLCGLIQSNTGKIHIDNKKLEPSDLTQWRRQIAYIAQKTIMFNGSIRDNLCWSCADRNDEELWQVLALVSAKDFVTQLPDKLDTQVGENGSKLSGGECQRIALARALLRKPQLLILDEATNALDDANQQVIQQSLNKLRGKLTIIIVSHQSRHLPEIDYKIQLRQY